MRQATTAWIMALTGLALVTGCGKKEMDEEKAREVESFLEEVSEVTNLHLDRYMAVHSRFLEVRNEEPGTPLQAGKAPFGGTAADSENPNTHILFYDSTVDDRFPTKYKDLSYWRGVSALTAMLETPRGVKADLDQQVWDPFQKIQFEEFALALEEFQYVVIVRGKTEKAVVEAGKKTGYRPGFFSGAGFVFEVGSGKYLGQYPVKASSQAEVHHGSGTTPKRPWTTTWNGRPVPRPGAGWKSTGNQGNPRQAETKIVALVPGRSRNAGRTFGFKRTPTPPSRTRDIGLTQMVYFGSTSRGEVAEWSIAVAC